MLKKAKRKSVQVAEMPHSCLENQAQTTSCYTVWLKESTEEY